MKITNLMELPEPIVRAIRNDGYTKGGADFSVTELLKPPRQRALQVKHQDDLEEDAADRLWALFGQLGHLLIERAGSRNELTEKRYFMDFGTKKISGQVDSLSLTTNVLTDWKFTSAYAVKGQPVKPEWVAQLNMQKMLLESHGHEVKFLQICAILRDWSKREAERSPDYPQKGVIVLPIEVWQKERTILFVTERIMLHEAARERLPECSKEDRWAKDTEWALMVKGLKRAKKLFPTRAAAELALDYVKDSYIEERPGESTRCKSYCSAQKFCDQYKKENIE